MKIAIDCRYLGKSGIGRVCEGILDALDYHADEFILIGDPVRLEKYKSAQIVCDLSEPYSFSGLCSFDKRLNQTCDALLIPNFLIPFGVKIPVHTIMHDLAFLDVKETTRGIKDKLIKRILLKRCMKRSKTIACVSEFTRSRCEHYYGKLAKKCYVNYNGISEAVFQFAQSHVAPSKKDNTIVFVGNVKPHKGLSTLLSAFSKVQDGSILKIIGEKDRFLTGMKLEAAQYPNVEFTGKLDDETLFLEIQRARYLVLPSKYEGFGLPPLEALALGTQPIVSDIPVFHEVYANLPVKFFHSEEELTNMIQEIPEKINCLEYLKLNFHFDMNHVTYLNHIKQHFARSRIE